MRWYELEPAVRGAIGAIFVALALSSILVRVLRAVRPGVDWSEVAQRVRTWWIIAGVFSFSIVASRTVSILFYAFISYLALKEYLSLIPTRRADRRVLFWAYLAIPLQFFWVYCEWYGMFIIFIPVYMFLLLPMRMVSIGQTDGFIRAAGTLHWGLMTMVFSISHAAFLLILRLKEAPESRPGPGLVLMLVVLTELNDIAQFVWGKTCGKRKILPTVSPGKTWGGFLGGVATTVVLATFAGPWLTPMNHRQAAFAGLIIGVGGFVGDVCISAMKRDLKIKDSGALLPGHGGMLDRIDSLTYTAPLYFHYVYWLYLFHTHGAEP
ncbi:MAG: phosphatidate cytidylyltransferase [Planctomycetaceae bacterium]|nr:phosphatidate cytidylyltransferase [Planctomycetaceae bacterium]